MPAGFACTMPERIAAAERTRDEAAMGMTVVVDEMHNPASELFEVYDTSLLIVDELGTIRVRIDGPDQQDPEWLRQHLTTWNG